jgi:hypothetical protein
VRLPSGNPPARRWQDGGDRDGACDNPGTSITNAAEDLASQPCDRLGIEPDLLVWIEHYGYAGSGDSGKEHTYDRVTFAPGTPDGRPTRFKDPQWRVMQEQDWLELGLAPRKAVRYS